MRWATKLAAGTLVALSAVVVRTQFIDVVAVSSDSMAPTVCAGDILLLVRLDDDDEIRVDDIVTFTSPVDGTPTIKRVVAVADQTVAIHDAQLVIDGSRVSEPYVDHSTIDGVYFGTVTVPPETVFVLGDQREVSLDSRLYGPISADVIEGRLLSRLWSGCETHDSTWRSGS